MKIIVLLFIVSNLLFAQLEINSQSFKGVIRSSVNGNPIAEALITISGTQITRISNSDGYFFLNNIEISQCKISILAIGYQALDTTVVFNNTGLSKYIFTLCTDCPLDQNTAKEDISNGVPKLLIVGSIAPIANTENDDRFEEKYKITYFDYGDTPPAGECIKEYNKIIFKYLNEKYGVEWKNNVRDDVYGL